MVVSTVGMVVLGAAGALLGGANAFRGGLRVLCGGWLALGVTYGIGKAFGAGSVS